MALTFDAIVDRVVAQFDIAQATAVAYVNERHARMCADAFWRSAEKSLGNTVAGTSRYTLPAEVIDLRRIRIDDSTGLAGVYDPVSIEDLWMLDSDPNTALVGAGAGVFAECYQDDGDVEVRLYPTPSASGLAILGLQVLAPAAMVYGAAASPIVPDDLRPYLLDGAFADGYSQSEELLDRAAYYEQRFAEGTEKLRRRKNSRSTGPSVLRHQRRPWRR